MPSVLLKGMHTLLTLFWNGVQDTEKLFYEAGQEGPVPGCPLPGLLVSLLLLLLNSLPIPFQLGHCTQLLLQPTLCTGAAGGREGKSRRKAKRVKEERGGRKFLGLTHIIRLA